MLRLCWRHELMAIVSSACYVHSRMAKDKNKELHFVLNLQLIYHFRICLSSLCTFCFAFHRDERRKLRDEKKYCRKITIPSFSMYAQYFAQIKESEWVIADRAEASHNEGHREKDMLQSLSFLMILHMYKRKRAGVRDLSHLAAASRSQWLRVGSPVMFNRSPGEEKKEEKSFPHLSLQKSWKHRLSRITVEDISTLFTAGANWMRGESTNGSGWFSVFVLQRWWNAQKGNSSGTLEGQVQSQQAFQRESLSDGSGPRKAPSCFSPKQHQ